MKIDIDENYNILLKEVYNPIILESNCKEQLTICMRDSGFEFKYNDCLYEAKNGEVKKIKNKSHIGLESFFPSSCIENINEETQYKI